MCTYVYVKVADLFVQPSVMVKRTIDTEAARNPSVMVASRKIMKAKRRLSTIEPILTATLLSTKYFYLDEHLTPDYAIFTSWITVTVVWFICEATLFTTGCFQMIRNGRPTDDTAAPPKYEEVMSMRMKQEKMQLPNYENCLRVVRNDKTPCVIDISKVEEMLHGIQDSHPASTEGTLKNDSSI
ncbi:hypothetical protein Tcan_10634 [Toxocara canis]|uniref:Uncharacterized protein n=1 Tax=Toxocara canis TaxID=6265 RepID=A0A0B2VVU0_TOXCA|nr:hypothetical protein Tcan_10634 [Toxocara canis]